VFLRPELWVFVLALVLALAGVILGIALRVRAFLYAGVAFLVLNVLGQLLRFYPDQGLSRALILIGLGALITVGMVLFNLKREEIMQRIRIVRADLAAWE
jgi:predicted transporter